MPRIKKPEPKWNKGVIQKMLADNDRAVYRGVVAIFRRQTDQEQAAGMTQEDNGIGFNGVDAPLMSSFAAQLLDRGTLTPKQTAFARKKIMKYWAQLAKIADENDAEKERQLTKYTLAVAGFQYRENQMELA